MAYGLSFAPRFFYPDDVDNVEPSSQPTSVYQALLSMRQDTWQEMARDVFDSEGDDITISVVMDKVLDTDTGTDLTTPVEVWIDEEGFYSVDIYDSSAND